MVPGDRNNISISLSLLPSPLSSSYLPSITPSFVSKRAVFLSQFTTFVVNAEQIWTYALRGNNSGSNQVERKPHKLCPYHTITIPPNKNWVWNLCLTVYCTLNTYNCQIGMISVPLYIMDYLAYCLLRHTFINTYQLYYYLHILTHSSSSELELEQVHSHLPRRSSHLLTTSPSSLSSPPHHHHHNHHHHHIHVHNDHERSLWLSLLSL